MHSLRTFQKRPVFAGTVVAILALGIGATTAMFSVVKGSLLSPLPYPDAERLVRIAKNDVQRGWSHYPVSYRELDLWRATSESFEGLAALQYTGPDTGAITVDSTHRTVSRLTVTTNYFDVLDIAPFLGRTFVPEDEELGSTPSVVVSYGTWQSLLESDPDVVGKTLAIPGEGYAYRVVGVLPPGVDYPANADLYMPGLKLGAGGSEQIFEADVLARGNRFSHAIESKPSHQRAFHESQQGDVPSGVQRLAKELGVRKARDRRGHHGLGGSVQPVRSRHIGERPGSRAVALRGRT